MSALAPHTFDARSWRIIKEFTGIYGILTDAELQAMRSMSIKEFNAILHGVVPKELPLNLSVTQKWSRNKCFNWSKRWASLYYDTYHPGDVAEMRQLLSFTTYCTVTQSTPSSEFMPPIKKAKIVEKSTIDEIDWSLGTQVTHETITDYYNEQTKKNTSLCRQISTHPKKESIYNGFKLALKKPTQLCACGHVLSTNPTAQRNHFKSVKHTKDILKNINIMTVERWWRETGESPPGFTRHNSKWSHIIPADPKRSAKHPIAHKGSIDLVPHIDATLSGRHACLGGWIITPGQIR